MRWARSFAIDGFEKRAKAASFGGGRAISASYAVLDMILAQFEHEKTQVLVNDLKYASTTRIFFRCPT
jgi:hypothetical protein